MVRILPPKLKNPPSPAIVPKPKVAEHSESEATTEVVMPVAPSDESAPSRAPVLKYKTKNVKGAFAKEKAKATPKAKVKLTHNEKQAAIREQKKAKKLEKKEALKAAKKVAKKAKRTARRKAEGRKSAGSRVTTE